MSRESRQRLTQSGTFRLAWTGPFIREPILAEEVDQKAKRRLPFTAISLCGVSLVGFAVQVVGALDIPWAIAPCVFWALAALSLAIIRPRTASIFLFVLFTGVFACDTALLASRWTGILPWMYMCLASAALALIAIILVVNMPLRDPSWPDATISRPFTAPTNALRSPEDNLTLWQWMSVSWMSPLLRVGSKRQLNDEDVWLLGYEFQHRHLHNAFRGLKGSVIRRLLRANWIDLVILSALAILELVANYSTPVVLQRLLKSMESIEVSKRPAITFAALIVVLRLIAAQSSVFSLWYGRRCYERSRGEMITMLYEKTLNRKIIGGVQNEVSDADDSASTTEVDVEVLDAAADDDTASVNGETSGLMDGDAKKVQASTTVTSLWQRLRSKLQLSFSTRTVPEADLPASKGKILNLMRNDAYEISQRFWEIQTLINKPLGLILSLVLVWRLLGWSSLFGVAVVVVAQTINAVLARVLISWEKTRRRATDGKLQQISQFVEAIRHLRWYGWHPAWLARLMEARQKELNLKIITNLWTILIMFFNNVGSGLLPVTAFYAYTILAGKQLRIDIAFPALQLFAMLQANLREIPRLITTLLNASVAVSRIESFMAEPDKAEDDGSEFQLGDLLELENASFAWPGSSNNVLNDLSLSFSPGLTVVFGQVASGKTALLQALLGELDLRDGSIVKPQRPIGYCAQTPWLQSMSIRENILFTSSYDDARYKRVLDACALTTDLASFKHGDLSNIGENGIGLSGGQKARVALARAIYSEARILLLDDPLSALDQQTAEHLVTHCFATNLLAGRTTVLVTHRPDLCHGLYDQLVEISDGCARLVDDVSPLVSDRGLRSLLKETAHETIVTRSADEATVSAAVPDKFIEDEARQHGGVQTKVYWAYIKEGKLKWWLLVIVTIIFWRLARVFDAWFLKEWGEAYGEAGQQVYTFQLPSLNFRITETPIGHFFARFPNPEENVRPWLIGYTLIAVSQAVFFVLSECFMIIVTYTAGKAMFAHIMQRVSYATFRYYDVTPVGRLMNRLTSDVGTIDGNISNQFLYTAWMMIAWTSSVVVIASITPLFLIFSLALTLAFVSIFLRFLPTSQSLRRLEMVSLSPLMSNFGALLDGLTTVRAFHAQSQFQARVIEVTDAFQKMDHFYWSLQAWLMYRFDILSACSTFVLTVLAIYSGLTAGLTAFLLTAAARYVDATHALCRQYGQLQLDFVSVERVVELLHLEQEPPGDIEPSAFWPSYDSDIVFENVTIRYAPHLDPALSNVSFRLRGGSNTAVIGRTGSGKSTLALALLATITPESGRILIGGVDLARVDKQALRTRITFLAQDPILFPGSLRHNLDPTNEHSDGECEAVIARVCGNYNWKLQTEIDVGGKNLSQGQRQLVGLARAVLRRSAIIIMDEATASIDKETAWEIQRVLREEMKGSTVVTIAHRPSAVRGADYCLALANGELVEQGSPDGVMERQAGAVAGQEDKI